jgi:hypothetical protein
LQRGDNLCVLVNICPLRFIKVQIGQVDFAILIIVILFQALDKVTYAAVSRLLILGLFKVQRDERKCKLGYLLCVVARSIAIHIKHTSYTLLDEER